MGIYGSQLGVNSIAELRMFDGEKQKFVDLKKLQYRLSPLLQGMFEEVGKNWISTGNSLIFNTKGKLEITNQAESVWAGVKVIYKDDAGDFWLGGTDGLARISM